MNFDIFIYSFALILLSFVSAMIGFAFNKMMDPNMIFSLYHEFLGWLAYKEHKTLRGIICNKFIGSSSQLLHHIGTKYIYKYGVVYTRQSKLLYYIAKPLGLCIICNTCWIGMILTFILKFIYNDISILDVLLVGLISAGFVILIENKYNQIRRG